MRVASVCGHARDVIMRGEGEVGSCTIRCCVFGAFFFLGLILRLAFSR